MGLSIERGLGIASQIVKAALVGAVALGSAGCVGATQEDVNVAVAEYGLANDAFMRQSYREALDHIEKALDADENNADAAYLGALTYLVFCANDASSPDCRYDDAEKLARRAVEADPNQRDAKNALGVILVHQGRPAEAVKVLEPLAQDILYRSPEKAWGNLGWAYLEANNLEKAIPALQRSVAAQPLFCVGHYRLGLAHEKKGDFTAAERSLSRALAIEEGDCGKLQVAFWARARIWDKLGKVAERKQDLEQCRKLASNSDTGKKCTSRLRATP
jgi:type IV pilus assembly protein PilF